MIGGENCINGKYISAAKFNLAQIVLFRGLDLRQMLSNLVCIKTSFFYYRCYYRSKMSILLSSHKPHVTNGRKLRITVHFD